MTLFFKTQFVLLILLSSCYKPHYDNSWPPGFSREDWVESKIELSWTRGTMYGGQWLNDSGDFVSHPNYIRSRKQLDSLGFSLTFREVDFDKHDLMAVYDNVSTAFELYEFKPRLWINFKAKKYFIRKGFAMIYKQSDKYGGYPVEGIFTFSKIPKDFQQIK